MEKDEWIKEVEGRGWHAGEERVDKGGGRGDGEEDDVDADKRVDEGRGGGGRKVEVPGKEKIDEEG